MTSIQQLLHGAIMFERFSDSARQVMIAAPAEAMSYNHYYIGAEHPLLAMLGTKCPAATLLKQVGITHVDANDKIQREDECRVFQNIPQDVEPTMPKPHTLKDLDDLIKMTEARLSDLK